MKGVNTVNRGSAESESPRQARMNRGRSVIDSSLRRQDSMRAVVQRVKEARVEVNESQVGRD